MAKKGNFSISVEGDKRLVSALEQLKDRTRKNFLRKAVRAAAKPTVKRAKANAPVKTTGLKRSITTKVKTYKNGTVVAIVGPRRGQRIYKATKRRGELSVDAFYGWFVERGTKAHFIFGRRGGAMLIPGAEHPMTQIHVVGIAPTRFIKRSFDTGKDQAKNEFKKSIWSSIEKEARKLGSQAAR